MTDFIYSCSINLVRELSIAPYDDYFHINFNEGYDDAVWLSTYLLFTELKDDLQYITWVSDGKPSWTLNAAGMAADPSVEISARPVPQEPMVILPGRPWSINADATSTVHHNEPGHVKELRQHWLRTSCLPEPHAGRLRAGLPGHQPHQHWMQPSRLPNWGLYQQVRPKFFDFFVNCNNILTTVSF